MSQEQLPQEIRDTPVFEGRVVRLHLKEVRMPSGHVARLEVVHHPGAAAVLPLHEDGTVTLIHQYRHAAGGFLYEIPAGLLEPAEAPIDCAARELTEETGLSATHLAPLTAFLTAPGFSDEVVHLFCASGLSQGAAALEPGELLTCERFTLSDAVAMIGRGEITDGKTQVALLMAAANKAGATP